VPVSFPEVGILINIFFISRINHYRMQGYYMADPELRSDEKVLLRSRGLCQVDPFEGILTNKRIILVDRARTLHPRRSLSLP